MRGHLVIADISGYTRFLTESELVRDFIAKPLNLTAEYTLYLEGEPQNMVGQVSPVANIILCSTGSPSCGTSSRRRLVAGSKKAGSSPSWKAMSCV